MPKEPKKAKSIQAIIEESVLDHFRSTYDRRERRQGVVKFNTILRVPNIENLDAKETSEVSVKSIGRQMTFTKMNQTFLEKN